MAITPTGLVYLVLYLLGGIFDLVHMQFTWLFSSMFTQTAFYPVPGSGLQFSIFLMG